MEWCDVCVCLISVPLCIDYQDCWLIQSWHLPLLVHTLVWPHHTLVWKNEWCCGFPKLVRKLRRTWVMCGRVYHILVLLDTCWPALICGEWAKVGFIFIFVMYPLYLTFLETVTQTQSVALVGCGQKDTCFTLADSGSHLSLLLWDPW